MGSAYGPGHFKSDMRCKRWETYLLVLSFPAHWGILHKCKVSVDFTDLLGKQGGSQRPGTLGGKGCSRALQDTIDVHALLLWGPGALHLPSSTSTCMTVKWEQKGVVSVPHQAGHALHARDYITFGPSFSGRDYCLLGHICCHGTARRLPSMEETAHRNPSPHSPPSETLVHSLLGVA